MCLIKGAFVGEKNFDVITTHGTTIKNLKKKCLCKLHDTKYTKFIKGPSTYSAFLVSSEIYITIFCKLFLKYVIFTNVTLIRF